MADAEPEAEDGSEDGGGGGGQAVPGPTSSAIRMAPLGPEQLRRVLEQVTKAQPPPPPFVLQDAARRLRDAAQQAALQRGPGAAPPRPPRLLPPQQLEAICVKVTFGETQGQERPMPPLATIRPPATRLCQLPQSQPRGVSGSQLLRGHPLPGAKPWLCLLRDSPRPPVPVLAPRLLPALGPVPVARTAAPRTPHGRGATATTLSATGPPAATPVSSSSAGLLISNLHTKHTDKLKKSFQVKTRSGRISRPPKYKARDYKFIKTEDLADGHPSDSDDYSELSVEEDEERGPTRALFDLSSCLLRPRAFKCQTCDKSYIGMGGLARHLKLNPGHGRLEPALLLCEKAGRSVSLSCAGGRTLSLPSPGLSTPALKGHCVEGEEALASEPAHGSSSALLGSERHPGPRRGCPTAPAEPRTAGLEEENGAAEPRFLQHCDLEQLVELALPRLAQAVPVYEFLLMKVGKGRPAEPFFPAVYREFEELHKMVKKMGQDYLHSSGPHAQEPLEINNSEVAESLGLTEELLRKRETHTARTPRVGASPELVGGQVDAASGQKRGSKTAEEGLVSAVKRPRRPALPRDAMESPAADSGGPGRRAMCATAPGDGFAPRVNGDASHHPEEGHGMPTSSSDTSTSQAGQQIKALADLAAGGGCADPALPQWDVSGPGLHAQLGGPGTLAQGHVAAFPRQNAQGYSSDLNTGDSLRSQGHCSSLVSMGGAASLLPGGSKNTEAGKPCTMPDPNLGGRQPSPSEVLLTEVMAPPPEKASSTGTVPATCAHSTVYKQGAQLNRDRVLSRDRHLGSPVGALDQFSCGPGTHTEQRGLQSIVAVGGTVAFEITNGCHELLSQAQEQIFVQTSDGLVLPHPGPTVSGEDIVILTHAEGPALPMGPPEGALGTMEAEPSL